LIIFLIIFLKVFLIEKEINSNTIYLFLGMSILSILNVRQLKLMIIILLFLFCDLQKSISFDIFHKYLNPKHGYWIIIIRICLIVSLLSIMNYQYKNNHSDNLNEIVEYLNENEEKDVKIFTDFNTGTYFIWNQYTNIYFEARPELYMKSINKKEDVIDEYIQLINTTDENIVENFIEKYNFKYYLTSKNVIGEETLNQYLKEHNFDIIFENDYYILYKIQEE
jgi:hypothetical protein